MTRTVAAVTTWLALTAVLIVAGGHTVYYLLEWEWVRAQIAGIAFVSALVVSATLVLLTRLRALERRLDVLVQAASSAGPGGPAGPAAPLAAEGADPEPRPDFAWLSPPAGWSGLALPLLALVALRDPTPAVFIPVFLATGIAVSVVASGVERLAARRQVAMAPAAGRGVDLAGPRPVSNRAAMGVLVVGVLVIGAVIGGLWLTAHYWSAPLGPGTTTLTLEVERNALVSTDVGDADDADVAEALGRYCVLTSGVDVHFGDVAPGPDGQVLLRVSPLLDEEARRRFGGCLEDAVLDRHRVAVTDVRLAPR